MMKDKWPYTDRWEITSFIAGKYLKYAGSAHVSVHPQKSDAAVP